MNDRLMSLLGHERRVQVELLVALAELNERRLYLDLGYGSLWDYCMRALHLREKLETGAIRNPGSDRQLGQA